MKRKLLVAAAVVAAAGCAYGARALANADTQDVHGHLVSQAVTGPACTSPVGLCTAGRLEGTINGEFAFTATSLQPTTSPGVFFYTGNIVVHTTRGEVRCEDAGAYSFADPTGPVVDLCTVTGGTGDWSGATGNLRIHGVFTLAGGGDSHYEGAVSR